MKIMWKCKYKKVFLKELGALPVTVRETIKKLVFDEEVWREPFQAGKLQKLKGYQDYYKVRIGSYRIGLKLDARKREIIFCRVLHRRDIYRHFP